MFLFYFMLAKSGPEFAHLASDFSCMKKAEKHNQIRAPDCTIQTPILAVFKNSNFESLLQ
ncbi:hypothetical protein MTR_1g095770 [Medicago truncatula]|uniref:Uncharacterized protein n=1 Tax=Medicago truncatula TaxID=3880 RepID=G7I9M4_MEDTR|nr:hypothetical protein MTR_1g095770 [Medicago truncatula]